MFSYRQDRLFSIFSGAGKFCHAHGLGQLTRGVKSDNRPLNFRTDLIFAPPPKTPNDVQGWSGGAMVLGKLPVPGRSTILITVGQGPIALAAGAGGGCLDIFTLIYPFSSFFLPLGDGPL